MSNEKEDDYYIVTAYGDLNGKKTEYYTVTGIKGEDRALEKALYFESFYKERGIDIKTDVKKMERGNKNGE